MGRRVKKTVYAYGSGGWQLQKEILFVYDGWNLIHEKEVSGTGDPLFDKFYVWGLDLSQSIQGAGGIGGLVCRVSGGEVRHYFYDANGNVGQLVNPTDGSITGRYEYDPFGNTVFTGGADAEGNAFRFSTKYWNGKIQNYYYGYRYYVPNLGRWLSRDQIKERGGRNLYAFIKNRPVNYFDYLGLVDEQIRKFMDRYKSSELYYETKSDALFIWKEPIPPQYDELFIYPFVDPHYEEYPEINAYDPTPKCPKGYHYDSKANKCYYGKPVEIKSPGKEQCWYCRGGSNWISVGLDTMSIGLLALPEPTVFSKPTGIVIMFISVGNMGFSAWICSDSTSTYTALADISVGAITWNRDEVLIKTSAVNKSFSDITIGLNKKVQLTVTLADLLVNFWEIQKD